MIRLKSWLIVGTLSGLVLGQLGCQPDPGEALNERKRRENAVEIETYLRKTNLWELAQQQGQPTASGLYIIKTKTVASAQLPATGDELMYHFVRQRLDSVIVDSTDIVANKPNVLTFGSPLLNSTVVTARLYEGLSQLREGEQAILLAPFDVNDNKTGTLLLPAFTSVRYDVTVVGIRTEEEQIQDYLITNSLTAAEKTESGLRFLRTKAYPDSAQVKSGQTVKVKYTGKLLNGTQFDSNANGIEKRIGISEFIPGWEEAIIKMRVGEKAIIVLPSSLGYGVTGSRNASGAYTIQPYKPLVFEMEVVSAK